MRNNIYTMADRRDAICNMKALKNIKPKVNKEKYKQVFSNYIGICTKMTVMKKHPFKLVEDCNADHLHLKIVLALRSQGFCPGEFLLWET